MDLLFRRACFLCLMLCSPLHGQDVDTAVRVLQPSKEEVYFKNLSSHKPLAAASENQSPANDLFQNYMSVESLNLQILSPDSVAPMASNGNATAAGNEGDPSQGNTPASIFQLASYQRVEQGKQLSSVGTPQSTQYSVLGHAKRLFRRRVGYDQGLGVERVMFAPLVIETAMGLPSTSVRFAMDRGLGTPDRLEFVWASPTIGPQAESRLDILDTILRTDIGTQKAMAIVEYRLRSLNPTVNDNTTGFSDLKLGSKLLLMDGRCTKVASVFNTYLKTGPIDRGLGTGHLSLEPGFLLRQQLSNYTFFHGEATYWLPIAGTPGFAGDVVKLNAGLSTVWIESDLHAVMPTLEFESLLFLAGAETDSLGVEQRVNGNYTAYLYPGIRIARGTQKGIGVTEFAINAGLRLVDEDWFDSRVNFQIRFAK